MAKPKTESREPVRSLGRGHIRKPHELPARQTKQHLAEQAIVALLLGKSVRKAAEDAGLGHRTLQDWLKQDWFSSMYNAAKRELLDRTINMLRSAGEEGVRTLRAVAGNKRAAPTARVSAGRGLLEVLLRAVEVQDLIARIERLEAATKGDNL